MTRPIVLGALAVAAALLSGLLEWWLQTAGMTSLPLPLTIAAVLLAASALVIWAGLPVRRWNAGARNRPLDPLRATRTVALAKASAHAGAIFTGWYFGSGLGLVADLGIEPRRDRFIVAMLTTSASLVLTGCGLLVERWCRRPDDEDEEPAHGREVRS